MVLGEKVSSTFNAVNDADVDAKISQGCVPVASADELRAIGDDEQSLIFGKDTK